MDRERLDDWCQKCILGLVLAILVYGPLATGSVRPQDFLVIEWLTLLVLVVWMARFWINPKHRLYWPPVCWAVLAFIGYACGRYLTADLEYVARQEWLRVLVYGILFLAIIHNLHQQETTQIIALTVVFLAMLISLYALYQFLTGSDRVWNFIRPDLYAKRGSGTYICPNHLAGYLEMILPVALAYTLTGRFRPVTKIFLGYASLIIFVGIMTTVSRGGWVAAGVSLVALLLWLLKQRDYRFQGLIMLGVFISIALVFIFKASFSMNRYERLNLATQMEDVRVLLWKPAWRMWLDHPLWGVGPAHFDTRFRQYRPPNKDLQARPDRVHNDYLNTLVDWGLVGTVLVAAAWILFFWNVVSSWKYVQRSQNDLESKRSNRSSLVMGGSLGLLAILIHSLFDYNMHVPANAIMAVTLMALVTSFFRFATEKYWRTPRGILRPSVTILLGAALVYLGSQTWKKTKETHWLLEAEEAPACSDLQLQDLQRADEIEPENFETPYRIGECYRLRAWEGQPGYEKLTHKAMEWFERSQALNALDPYGFLGEGMCLDWLGKHGEAKPYFERALKLDPNGYYLNALMGWHYLQVEDYPEAKKWLERSRELYNADNFIALFYLQLVYKRLEEIKRTSQ